MLPQWVFDWGLRPTIAGVSRLMWRMRWRNAHHIPRRGGLIIVSNHQTYLDPFWISVPIKRPIRYMAWNAVFDWAVVGRLIGFLGAWPLRIEGTDTPAVRRALQWIQGGGAVVIFPEGGRGNPDGTLRRFKDGAARMALEANVPILPVTIRGGDAVWHQERHRLPRPGRVEITYHPLVVVARRPGESARDAARRETARLEEIVQSVL